MIADWVAKFADDVIAEADRRAPGKPIVCASGLSPSGPIHLGNLREVMTPHLVADEIRRRGRACVHLLSWDDYDRFRRVPAGVDPSWAEHVGKPLTSVPAPPGSEHASWAEHFKAPLTAALAELGIEVEAISQTERYTAGAYRKQILRAMEHRVKIDAILEQYRTKPVERYSPYKPYCALCERDLTTVTAYDDESTELAYTCACGFGESVRLAEHDRGKLVWKVDWPMRWAYEGVVFEPSGVDHHSPGSAWIVGEQIVGEVFGGAQPRRRRVWWASRTEPVRWNRPRARRRRSCASCQRCSARSRSPSSRRIRASALGSPVAWAAGRAWARTVRQSSRWRWRSRNGVSRCASCQQSASSPARHRSPVSATRKPRSAASHCTDSLISRVAKAAAGSPETRGKRETRTLASTSAGSVDSPGGSGCSRANNRTSSCMR
ncbi:lysine--tRNA ligase [Nonomuraea sp. NPDC055795]